MAQRVTNAQILEALSASEARRHEQMESLRKELAEVKEQLRLLNGTVRQHSVDIALLQERVGSHGTNWWRVWQIVQFVLTLVLAAALAKIGLG